MGPFYVGHSPVQGCFFKFSLDFFVVRDAGEVLDISCHTLDSVGEGLFVGQEKGFRVYPLYVGVLGAKVVKKGFPVNVQEFE